MARKNSGWYTFTDGYTCWCHGMSAAEKKSLERAHGQLLWFEPTP